MKTDVNINFYNYRVNLRDSKKHKLSDKNLRRVLDNNIVYNRMFDAYKKNG